MNKFNCISRPREFTHTVDSILENESNDENFIYNFPFQFNFYLK